MYLCDLAMIRNSSQVLLDCQDCVDFHGNFSRRCNQRSVPIGPISFCNLAARLEIQGICPGRLKYLQNTSILPQALFEKVRKTKKNAKFDFRTFRTFSNMLEHFRLYLDIFSVFETKYIRIEIPHPMTCRTAPHLLYGPHS